MSDEPLPKSEIILYQTEDGRTRVQCRFEDETVWLTQKLMADLFQIGVGTVNHHLKAIFAEGELMPGATIRRYRIVQSEGARQIGREVEHYNPQGARRGGGARFSCGRIRMRRSDLTASQPDEKDGRDEEENDEQHGGHDESQGVTVRRQPTRSDA